MEVTPESLRERYSNLSDEELQKLLKQSTLTDMAAQVLREEIARREAEANESPLNEGEESTNSVERKSKALQYKVLAEVFAAGWFVSIIVSIILGDLQNDVLSASTVHVIKDTLSYVTAACFILGICFYIAMKRVASSISR